MARVLLDTTFLIDVLNDRGGRADVLERMLLEEPHRLACCAINVAEVYAGLRAPEARATEKLLRELEYVPISWGAAQLAGELRREWRSRGQTFHLADALIAAVCPREGLTLATDNRKHFPMSELLLDPLPEGTA